MRGARRLRRSIKPALSVLLLVGWALTLRPQMLGGPATYLVVRGTSMLPRYETGDLVILRAQPSYAVGDAVGYRVPAGEIGAGRVVLHRIIGGASAGFTLQGDNNEAPDPWTPGSMDIAGSIWIVIPGVGRILDWLHQPAVIASLAVAVVIMLSIGRAPPETGVRVDALPASAGDAGAA